MDFGQLDRKKQLLDRIRPLSEDLVRNLEEWFDIELTYSSNAIEGNTLSRRETALVVEKGITVSGKTIREHLEAVNHKDALIWLKSQIAKKPNNISKEDIFKIHEIILRGIDDANAGRLRNIPVRILGSAVVLPNHQKIFSLMEEFLIWLQSSKLHPVELAAEAHYQLVTIHPFVDGNGRTARLLMNMILLMEGYPVAIIRKQDRLAYIKSLEVAQLGGSKESYLKLILKAVDRSLDIYLKAAKGENVEVVEEETLLKIGEVAKLSGETNSTIRHWTKLGLLQVSEITPSNYQMYSNKMVNKAKKIRELSKQRFTLEEIKEKFNLE